MQWKAGLMRLFRVERRPIPWRRAISSGLSLGIPILISMWFGRLNYGLLACFGGFAYLYVSHEPYAKRARRLIIVMAGLALSFGLGALGASLSVWSAALVLGLVGAGAYFLCEVFGLTTPGAFFIVFACAVGTSTPGAPSIILARVGLIFLGGIPAWLIAMAGWLWRPLEPETTAVSGAYRQLASLLATVGTAQLHSALHKATLTLRSLESAFSPAAIRWRRPDDYLRLLRLSGQADGIFLAIIELTTERHEPVAPKVTAAVRALADAIGDPDRAACLIIPETAHPSAGMAHLYRELWVAVDIAADASPAPMPAVERRGGTLRSVLSGALDQRALVLPRALRIGFMLLITHLVANALGAHSPYWVAISCLGVMLGTTVVATMQRTVQRLLGTLIGALLGALILALHPSGISIVLALMAVQALVEISIMLNYTYVVTFATPLAFIIVGAGHPEWSVGYVVSARLIDTLLGSVLGLGGTLLLRRRSSTQRLLGVLGSALRAEGSLVSALLTAESRADRQERDLVQRSLITLRIVYDAALADEAEVESLWPAAIAVQRLGYLLIALAENRRRGPIAREGLSELEALLETLASAVTLGQPPSLDRLPIIPAYPAIGEELGALAQGLQVLQLGPRPA